MKQWPNILDVTRVIEDAKSCTARAAVNTSQEKQMGNFENDLRALIEEWRGKHYYPESMAAALCDAAADLVREAVDRQVAVRDAEPAS